MRRSLACLYFYAALALPASLGAGETFGDDFLELSSRFTISSNDDIADVDYVDLEAQFEGRFKVKKNWVVNVEVEVATDEVEAKEIWTRYKKEDWKIKLGMYENEILLEDRFSRKKVPFFTDS